MKTPSFVHDLREKFPVLKRTVEDRSIIYLDSAATTLRPQQVIESVSNYYTTMSANVHRGLYKMSEEATQAYESARDEVQSLLNAKEREEVIFTKGTTESINLVANSFGEMLSEGDEVIITEMEHHSNIVPWQLLKAKKGIQLKVIKVLDNGELDLSHFQEILSGKTKLVAFMGISNVLGTVNPIKQITKMAHEVGAKVLVDGAQTIAHENVDVQDLDVDFFAFSSHKIYGPTGVGVLYGKREILEAMPPFLGGGDMIDVVSFEETTFNDLPYKFEAGTPNIAGVIGFGEAIRFFKELNHQELFQYERDLTRYGQQLLSDIPGIRTIGNSEAKVGALSFVMDGVHAHDVASMIDRYSIAMRTGHHCAQPLMQRFGVPATVRASVSLYNTPQELDHLAESLPRIKKIFGV